MTTVEEDAQKIRDCLHQFSGITVSDFVRTEELGSQLDFSRWESSFDDLKQMATQLSNSEWSRLPHRTQTTASETLCEIFDAMSAIVRFSANEGSHKRDDVADRFGSKLDAFKEIALTYGGYLLWEGSSGEERILPVLQEAEQRLQSIRKGEEEIEKTKSEVDSVLETVRGAAAEKGVSQEAAAFSEAAKRYHQLAQQWFRRSLVAGAVTIGFVLVLVFAWDVGGQISDANAVQVILAKAAALAVLSYATITSVRLYRSNAHLAVVNQHREDALRTFQTFVDSSSDTQVRDKVLLAAANAAFGQTATGLIGERGDGGNTIEVIEGLLGPNVRHS